MTTYYVNGKRVPKDELCKYEIRNEKAKQVFAEKLSHTQLAKEKKCDKMAG